ncbi:uncharacterized protein JN550_013747, partial [Neoarthrinium moseri]|uniref:uncharacterized protein n=1 Tax=Neoarthrinium moseri TaxID=1658444 RepID=UPI001FDE5563
MAAPTPFGGKLIDHDATDLGTMWEEALIKYNEECKINLRNLDFIRQNSMDNIMAEQERQLARFGEARHDGGKLDKFRSAISKNSQVIMSVAATVANAASSAFPPSAVILTAFNYVMNASKAVSDDLDMIVSFFDIMKAFLSRVSLLEERTPPERQFRQFLMNVFSALLTMCAIATKIQQKGRLKQWARALVDGTDPKLKAAYDTVHMHLERFESAVMIMTLKKTIESGSKLDGIGRDINAVQAGVQQTIHLGQQNLEIGQQNYMMGMEISVYAKDSASTSHAILTAQEDTRVEVLSGLKKLEKMAQKSSRDKQTSEAPRDAGARRTTALIRLQDLLDYKVNDQKQIEDLENAYVANTCEWIQEIDVYHDFELGDVPLLSLTGATGIGKSMVSYTALRRMQREAMTDHTATTSVAYFFFREDYAGRRSLPLMLRSCVIQLATHNISYRSSALATRQRLREFDGEDYKLLWEHFFRQQFNNKVNRRLTLILDGIDEANEECRAGLKDIFAGVASDQDLQIQIMFSCENDGDMDPDGRLGIKRLSMTREKIKEDMRTIAISRLKSLSRIRKLTTRTKKRVAVQLCKKAD